MKRYKQISEAQIELFLTRGHIMLRGCFERDTARKLTDEAMNRLGIDFDPSTWDKPIVRMPSCNRFQMHEFAPKAWSAACELLGGEERVATPCWMSDAFIINLAVRADQPWQEPSAASPGWHKDGDFFRHFLDSPEQGLLTLVFWSDTRQQGGGTFVACDSVGPVARYLAAHPEGLMPNVFNFGTLVTECADFAEVVGDTGDIALIHPFILHATSQNLSGRPRFLTNPPVHLREPMNFNRADPDDFSLVELAVLRALGV